LAKSACTPESGGRRRRGDREGVWGKKGRPPDARHRMKERDAIELTRRKEGRRNTCKLGEKNDPLERGDAEEKRRVFPTDGGGACCGGKGGDALAGIRKVERKIRMILQNAGVDREREKTRTCGISNKRGEKKSKGLLAAWEGGWGARKTFVAERGRLSSTRTIQEREVQKSHTRQGKKGGRRTWRW